jgi:hypothetical protein
MECWRTERSGRADYSDACCAVNRSLSTRFYFSFESDHAKGNPMNNIVYIVGLIVIVLFILGFFGLR